MTEATDQSNKIAEVAGLAEAIAERILYQHEVGTSIPPDQFTMLVRAARMLIDNGVPWPPSVEYVIMEVAKRVEEAKATSPVNDVIANLTQALARVKRS